VAVVVVEFDSSSGSWRPAGPSRWSSDGSWSRSHLESAQDPRLEGLPLFLGAGDMLVDVEPDDVAHLGGELRIIGELEGAEPLRG
jgi:hypothetical protein